ncbi:MAG: hypothetical protein ACD_10C00114G0001 [uncultured bacterium]|nr:MAG: hypothetical protein ACD_10C00114G0001 [uncultured bacterium]
MKIDQRLQHPGHIVEQVHRAIDAGQPARAIVRADHRHLDQRPQPVDPSRAVQQRILATIQEQIVDFRARQPVPRLDRLTQPKPAQFGFRLWSNDFNAHNPASSLLKSPSATRRAAQPCQLSN